MEIVERSDDMNGIVGLPQAISRPYAAILGMLVVYPAIFAMWWRFNRPGGRGR